MAWSVARRVEVRCHVQSPGGRGSRMSQRSPGHTVLSSGVLETGKANPYRGVIRRKPQDQQGGIPCPTSRRLSLFFPLLPWFWPSWRASPRSPYGRLRATHEARRTLPCSRSRASSDSRRKGRPDGPGLALVPPKYDAAPPADVTAAAVGPAGEEEAERPQPKRGATAGGFRAAARAAPGEREGQKAEQTSHRSLRAPTGVRISAATDWKAIRSPGPPPRRAALGASGGLDPPGSECDLMTRSHVR